MKKIIGAALLGVCMLYFVAPDAFDRVTKPISDIIDTVTK